MGTSSQGLPGRGSSQSSRLTPGCGSPRHACSLPSQPLVPLSSSPATQPVGLLSVETKEGCPKGAPLPHFPEEGGGQRDGGLPPGDQGPPTERMRSAALAQEPGGVPVAQPAHRTVPSPGYVRWVNQEPSSMNPAEDILFPFAGVAPQASCPRPPGSCPPEEGPAAGVPPQGWC